MSSFTKFDPRAYQAEQPGTAPAQQPFGATLGLPKTSPKAEPVADVEWDAAVATRLEAEMYARVAVVYRSLPPHKLPSAEWDTYEQPINGSLAAIRQAKERRDMAALQAALLSYEDFAVRAAACFTEAIPPEPLIGDSEWI